MKKTRKIFAVCLALSLVLCAGLALTASAENEKTPEIISKNIEYNDKFSLMYAVDASTVTAPVTLNLYYADPASGAEVMHTYTAETPDTIKINGVDTQAYVFVTEGIAAKSLTSNFYVQAVDDSGAKSDVERYSVIEYMYERLSGKQTITENQKMLYRTVIEFASYTQQVLINDKTASTTDDVTLASEYSYVVFKETTGIVGETNGATTGYEAGIYPEGTVIYPYISGQDTITVTIYDDNAELVSSTAYANGAEITLDGDMTVITAGGEIVAPAWKPDLEDTAGRLCFDDGQEQNSYTKYSRSNNSGSIVAGTPYGTTSQVYKHTTNVNKAEIAWVKNFTTPATATKFVVELDLMFEATNSFSWYLQLRGDSVNPDEWRLKVDSGVVQLMGAGNNKAVADLGEWFRYKVVYTQENGAYVIQHYVNNEHIHTDTAMDKTTSDIPVTDMTRLRFYAESTGVGSIYFDNVKTYFE